MIYYFSFKGPVDALKFSPSGRHFAVGIGRRLQFWQTPTVPGTDANGGLEYAPFVLHRDLAGHFDAIRSIEWSSDSRFILTASKDLTAKIWSLDPEDGFEPTTLAGHRQTVKGAYFSADQETVGTIESCVWSAVLMQSSDIYSQSRWRAVSMGVHDSR